MRPLVALALALALFAPARPLSADVIHACVAKSNGRVRIVAVPGVCNTRTETPLDWDQSGPASGPFKLVGFTTATIVGNAGALDLTRACATQFTGSRTCTSAEVLLDPSPPEVASGDDYAWVLPTIVGGAGTGNPLDVSGFPVALPFCSVLGSPDNVGLVVNGHGRYTQLGCSEQHRVACCVPSN